LNMPIPSVLVTRFFELIVNRQFTEAERELERLKQKMQKTEWNRGYFRALYGMFLSRKANGESYTFFSKLNLEDKSALHSYRREFLEHMRNKLHGDFDRGFFSAWADCMRVLSKITISSNPTSPNVNTEPSSQESSETSESDKNQESIDSFLTEKD
jgi:hypothetical protein